MMMRRRRRWRKRRIRWDDTWLWVFRWFINMPVFFSFWNVKESSFVFDPDFRQPCGRWAKPVAEKSLSAGPVAADANPAGFYSSTNISISQVCYLWSNQNGQRSRAYTCPFMWSSRWMMSKLPQYTCNFLRFMTQIMSLFVIVVVILAFDLHTIIDKLKSMGVDCQLPQRIRG